MGHNEKIQRNRISFHTGFSCHRPFFFGYFIASYAMVVKVYTVESECQGLQGLCSYSRLQLTFPHRDAMPSHWCKSLLFSQVTSLIAFYLCIPKICVSLWQHVILAVLVPMPETTVDKDYRTILAQHNIWMTRQTRVVQPIAKPSAEQVLPHQNLRLGTLTSYRWHTTMALLLGQFVHKLTKEVVAIVSELIGADSDELTIQIIENDKRLAALREYAQTAWIPNPKLE